MKASNVVLGVAMTIAMAIAGFCGWSLYPKINQCPTITNDTVFVHDTTWHTIIDSIPYTIRDTIWLAGDTVEIPTDVDTAAILKDYFAVYGYPKSWDNDTISVNLYTTITQNKPIKYNFKYKLNMPFTTVINNIDNSVAYNKYIQFGLSMPVYKLDKSPLNIQDLSLEGTYVFPKGYAGAAWQPNTQSIMARAGVTLFKIKQIK